MISKLHSWRREEALAYQLISTTWLASYTGIGKLGKDSFTASLVSNHGSNLVQHGHNIENRRDRFIPSIKYQNDKHGHNIPKGEGCVYFEEDKFFGKF